MASKFPIDLVNDKFLVLNLGDELISIDSLKK